MSAVMEHIKILVEQPPADPAEVAECEAGRWEPVGTTIYDRLHPTVVRADPASLISATLLFDVIAGRSPCVTYDPDERLIKIYAENGTWIYRIGRPAPNLDAFCMRWPD